MTGHRRGRSQMVHESELLAIGAVAERTGLAPSALRFYEREGLISSVRTAGSQRRYGRDVLRRLAFIKVAQTVGVALPEIRAALAGLPRERTPTKADWDRIARAWRPRLDEQIDAFGATPGPAHRLHRVRMPVPAGVRARTTPTTGPRGSVPVPATCSATFPPTPYDLPDSPAWHPASPWTSTVRSPPSRTATPRPTTPSTTRWTPSCSPRSPSSAAAPRSGPSSGAARGSRSRPGVTSARSAT